MKVTPIPFKLAMARANWLAIKTNTRRIAKPQTTCRYNAGDLLWVREPWRVGKGYDDLAGSEFKSPTVHYEADGDKNPAIDWGRYRHGRFMPRWASRMTLKVAKIAVERLQEISEADAIAEGLTCLSKDCGRTYKYGIPDFDGLPGIDDIGWPWSCWETDPRRAYEYLWDLSNGEGAQSWSANPWVWVVHYEVIRKNVDEVLSEQA